MMFGVPAEGIWSVSAGQHKNQRHVPPGVSAPVIFGAVVRPKGMPEAVVEKKVGDMVEGYRILREVGRGAASMVYLVQDPKSKQIWAMKHVVKETPKDQRFLDQAEAEYKIASELDHPGIRKIVRLIKKGSLLNTRELYLVMEFVDGESEDQHPPRTFEHAVDVFYQVADALRHMHGKGYVHADMKPNNIMVVGGVAKIIDLGQSCKSGLVKERIQGTPDYIAPEQVHRRPITPKTDVYNLGATMYWTFTRRHIPTALAKDDSLVGSLDDHLIQKPTPAIELNRKIHPKLNDLIMHCVEVNPDKRPDNMAIVADRLNLILGILRARSSEGQPAA
jgi:eukaryotic-like serine/threonine-protein kinase